MSGSSSDVISVGLVLHVFDDWTPATELLLHAALAKVDRLLLGIWTTEYARTRLHLTSVKSEEDRFRELQRWLQEQRIKLDKVRTFLVNGNLEELCCWYGVTHLIAMSQSDPAAAVELPANCEIASVSQLTLNEQQAVKTSLCRSDVRIMLTAPKGHEHLYENTLEQLRHQGLEPTLSNPARNKHRHNEATLDIQFRKDGGARIHHENSAEPIIIARDADTELPLQIAMHCHNNSAPSSVVEEHKMDANRVGDFLVLMDDEKIQEGGYGAIYPAVLANQLQSSSSCIFVAKVITEADEASFEYEVALSVKAGTRGYGPKIHAHKLDCLRRLGFLIMDRWQGDMDDQQLYDSQELEEMLRQMDKMHQDGVFHQDLYLRNVLYRHRNGRREFCITDYGLAFQLDAPVIGTLRAADAASLIYGIYDHERVALMDGIQPKSARHKAVTWLRSSAVPRVPLPELTNGIRCRVLKTICEDGSAKKPSPKCDPLNDKAGYYIDALPLYKELAKKVRLDDASVGLCNAAMILERFAYNEGVSEVDMQVVSDILSSRFQKMQL